MKKGTKVYFYKTTGGSSVINHAPGWARNKARDQRTWAKPKGWRL